MENKELKTAAEMLLAANLNWTVEKRPLYDREGKELADFRAVTRATDGHVFQVSKPGYECIQNGQALALLDEVVESGYAKYSDARAFKSGAIVMVRAEVPAMGFDVAGDEIKTFLHVATSHDGSLATTLLASSQRMICQNLLGKTGAENRFSFRHTANYRLKLEDAKRLFDRYRLVFNKQKEQFEALARKQFNRMALDSFLDELLGVELKGEQSARLINQKRQMEYLFEYGKGNRARPHSGTAWSAFNAVTEYVDHYRSTKGDDSNREYASLLGSGAQMREKALVILSR